MSQSQETLRQLNWQFGIEAKEPEHSDHVPIILGVFVTVRALRAQFSRPQHALLMPSEGDDLQLPQTNILHRCGEGPEQALSRLVQDELQIPKGCRTHQAYGLSRYDSTHPQAVHTSDKKAVFPTLYMVSRDILDTTFTVKRPLYHAQWFQIPDAIKELESYGTETGNLHAGVLQHLPTITKVIEPF